MKLTVLLDNNTLIDRYFLGEPGVSYLIEDEGRKVLLDVGYSDAFIRNALKMGISLYDVDDLVLSHGHLDHTWGLPHLVQYYTEGMIEGLYKKSPRLVAHPDVFAPRSHESMPEFGSLLQPTLLSKTFELFLSREPVSLTERLIFLGEIERNNDFEAKNPIGKIVVDGVVKDDYIVDDSALVYQSPEGLVIITGCSHAGICNIVEQAKRVCGDDRIVDIIGGFHLQEPPAEVLAGTLDYMEALGPDVLHACHCTDLASKIALSKVANLKEVGVGMELTF